MSGDFDGVHFHAQFIGNFYIIESAGSFGNDRLEFLKQRALPFLFIASPQINQHLPEKGQSPLSLEQYLGGNLLTGFQQAGAALFRLYIQRNDLGTSTSLLTISMTPVVGHEMLHRSQQEGAQAAPILGCLLEIVTSKEVCKESLSEILGLGVIGPLGSDEGIDRRPIGLAECF